MAFPTAVNSQITDSITQDNPKVVGDSPAMGMGSLFVATSQALANAAHNATSSQQHANITAQASTTQAVQALLSISGQTTVHRPPEDPADAKSAE